VLGQIVATPETMLDIALFLALLIAFAVTVVGVLASVGDLLAALREHIPDSPAVTASIDGIVSNTYRFSILIAMCGIVLVRLFDRQLTGLTLFYALMWTILSTCGASIVSMVLRARTIRQAAALIDPCADCPYANSPFRHAARRNRERRGQPVTTPSEAHIATPAGDVHVTVTPPDAGVQVTVEQPTEHTHEHTHEEHE
jgi:hypothetical protein